MNIEAELAAAKSRIRELEQALLEVREELTIYKLSCALHSGTPEQITEFAADVANVAMKIADTFGYIEPELVADKAAQK